MEKVLKELETNWATMKFDIEAHSRTNVLLIQTSDELIETFEDNQVFFFYQFLDKSKIIIIQIY